MIYLQAFLVGGLFCLFGQLLFANTKLGVIKVFMISISTGVILSAIGLMGPIVAFGGGGAIVSIIDAGEGLFWGFFLLFQGQLPAILRFSIMIGLVLLIGVVCGYLTPKQAAGNEQQ